MDSNGSQLYLVVSSGTEDNSRVEMLTSAHLRPYVSICAAAHYQPEERVAGDKLFGWILPGEERRTTMPDTKCLMSFLVEVHDAGGKVIGTCNFNRVALIDHVNAVAHRMLRTEKAGGDANEYEEPRTELQKLDYCLHFAENGASVQPRVSIPPVRQTSINGLVRDAEKLNTDGTELYPGQLVTFLTRDVYAHLQNLAEWSERHDLEDALFLDGEVLFDVERRIFGRLINECIPAAGAERAQASITINGDSWANYYKARSARGILIAEAHSHPSRLAGEMGRESAMFISTRDKDIHRQHFYQYFQCTVIVSKPAERGFQLGIWGWCNGFILPEAEVYVI